MSERVYSTWTKDIYREWIDGRLRTEFHKHNGPGREWHANGQLQSESVMKCGVIDGLKREWHENGQLAKETQYSNGRINGLMKQWNTEGLLLGTCQLYQGLGIMREWYNDGKLKGEVEFFDEELAHGIVYDDLGIGHHSYSFKGSIISKRRFLELLAQIQGSETVS